MPFYYLKIKKLIYIFSLKMMYDLNVYNGGEEVSEEFQLPMGNHKVSRIIKPLGNKYNKVSISNLIIFLIINIIGQLIIRGFTQGESSMRS